MTPKQTLELARRVASATTHYETLDVPPRATSAQVRTAWLARVRVFHPDRYRAGDAHDLTAKVNLAYGCLSDTKARKLYDMVTKPAGAACARCDGTGVTVKQRGFAGKVRQQCTACGGRGVAI